MMRERTELQGNLLYAGMLVLGAFVFKVASFDQGEIRL